MPISSSFPTQTEEQGNALAQTHNINSPISEVCAASPGSSPGWASELTFFFAMDILKFKGNIFIWHAGKDLINSSIF